MIHSKALLKYCLIGFWLTLAFLLICIKNHSVNPMKDSELITHRLDTLQAQLGALHQEVKKPVEPVDLTPINQDFNKLALLIEQLKSNDHTTFNQLIKENRAELIKKLDALHEVIMALNKKHHPIKYLPVTSLPFKVISIDSIQQINVATVAYHFKTMPLEKSDTLAGWTVLDIDFGRQHMELENNNKDHVVVSMDRDQGESNA